MRRSGVGLFIAGALLLTGCSGGSTATTSSSTSSTAAAPSGPAVVNLTMAGGTGLSGAFTPTIVRCNEPTIAGQEILVIGSAPDSTLSVRMELTAGSVAAAVVTGSGAQFQERDFTGTGVSGFDAGKGATLNAPLSAVPPAAGVNLPALASITGTVDCAGQTPGSSAISISGTTADGAISGPISPVDITCSPTAGALIIGIVQIGGAKELIDMSVQANAFSFSTIGAPPANQSSSYKAPAGSATITSSTGTVNGDAVETVSAGATAHTLHLTGDFTCGQNPTAG